MFNYWIIIRGCFILALVAQLSGARANSPPAPLRISIECIAKNSACSYAGEDIPIIIRITNVSSTDAYLTAKYMQKSGPYVTFHDLSGNHRWYRGVKLADEVLLNEYTKIESGKSIEISSKLFVDELDMFARRIGSYEMRISLEFFAKWGWHLGDRLNFDEKGSILLSDPAHSKPPSQERTGAFRSR